MNFSTLQNILVITSGVALVIAISLTGGSLSKSVKWNLYKASTDYGNTGNGGGDGDEDGGDEDGGDVYCIYAFQNLWTYYDIFADNGDYAQVYSLLWKDNWRALPRNLVMASTGNGIISLIILIMSAIPVFQRKVIWLYIFMIGAGFFSLSAGGMLAHAVSNYMTNYPSLHYEDYNDPLLNFPQEDNVSTGFYMASIAVVFLFASAILNIFTIFVIRKKPAILPDIAKCDKSTTGNAEELNK